ncbi:hypothetical protein [Reyranella sp.]|uniref:hypothetical protein n=1 Tax=Reyranella sp. TaxID=1929291 RepID=UPI003D0A6CC4
MDRGLRAQLSPNEETALRRIAAGAADQDFIALRYLEHLAALNLIEAREGAWQLTKYGEMRVAGDKRDSS